MTVKVLTDAQKSTVVTIYQAKTKSIKELASYLNTSSRTIVRVLNESGYLTEAQLAVEQANKAAEVLRTWGISAHQLNGFLSELEDRGLLVTEDGKITALATPAPDRNEIIKATSHLEDGTWNALLADIVTARVAVQHNKHVQTNMLNLQNKVEANERDNKQHK